MAGKLYSLHINEKQSISNNYYFPLNVHVKVEVL